MRRGAPGMKTILCAVAIGSLVAGCAGQEGARGGTPGSAGSSASGGGSGTGGAPGIGGAPGTGGGSGTGGRSGSGGAPADGASVDASQGGSTGGAVGTGGRAGVGGSSGSGGNVPHDAAVVDSGPDAPSAGYQPCRSNPCKILPLGDSITFGVDDEPNGGYRGPLFADIVAAGQKITFTG